MRLPRRLGGDGTTGQGSSQQDQKNEMKQAMFQNILSSKSQAVRPLVQRTDGLDGGGAADKLGADAEG